MTLSVTAIGAWPKPPELPIVDWFTGDSTMGPEATLATNQLGAGRGSTELVAQLDEATREAVADQIACGVDVPTDGELRRENYLHYHCRHVDGIDFERLTERTLRNGSWVGHVPTFVGPISARDNFLARDYSVASEGVDQPVKITIPGPITLMDSTADAFYGDDIAWGDALARALNDEVLDLVSAGCTQVQIDEPAFARYPARAHELGFRLLDQVLAGVGSHVTVTLHMCCGYPDRLDNENYPKADPDAYRQLASDVDNAPIDIVSIEDAHRPNDLDLFRCIERATIAVGAVAIARSAIEEVEAVHSRLATIAEIVGRERLVVAPDCGLGLLDRSTAMAKLRVLRKAADRLT